MAVGAAGGVDGAGAAGAGAEGAAVAGPVSVGKGAEAGVGANGSRCAIAVLSLLKIGGVSGVGAAAVGGVSIA